MKTISAAMQTHLDSGTTTLATCWKLIRSDGAIMGFTNNARDITFEGQLYLASTGYTPSSIASTEDLAVDNLEIVGLLDSVSIAESDIFAGLYDESEIFIFMVNYEDLTMGDIKLKRGTLGEIRTGRVVFEAELRSHSQRLQQTRGEVFSVVCRADFGDARCGVVVTAPRWAGNTLYSAGDYVRATLTNQTIRRFLCTTGGYSASIEPTWDTTVANTTAEVGVDVVDDGIMANALNVEWFGAAEWTISGGTASCNGTQDAASSITQTPADLIEGVAYNTSFDLINWSAGQVRVVVGGTVGTWQTTTDATYAQLITAGAGTDIAIEGDVDFVGDIDNVTIIEDADAVWTAEASFLTFGAITTVNSNENFIDTGRAEADGFFNGGLLTFTSGANIGLSMEVKTFASDTFQLVLPFPFDVVVTDKYEVYQGCDKTLETCRDTFDNIINMRAEPYIPGMDEVSKFGGQ